MTLFTLNLLNIRGSPPGKPLISSSFIFLLLAVSAVTVCVSSTTSTCANSQLDGSYDSSSGNSNSSSSNDVDDEAAVLQLHLSSQKSAASGASDAPVEMGAMTSPFADFGQQSLLMIKLKNQQLMQLFEKGFAAVQKPFLDYGLTKADRLLVLGIVALTLVGALVRAFQAFGAGRAEPTYSMTSRTIQSLFLLQCFLFMVQSTIVIPESFDIAKDVGRGAADSGWLIGAAWPVSLLGAPLAYWATKPPWHQGLGRGLMVATGFMHCASSILYALAANPPAAWGWSQDVRFVVLMLSRLMQGFGFGACEPCSRMMAQHVSLPEELVPLSMSFSFSVSLGIGIGPLLSSAICWVFDVQQVRARSSVPLYAVAVAWAVFGAACLILLPLDLGELKKRSTSSQSQQASTTDSDSDRVPHRKSIWKHAALLCLERAFLISALEAASAYILQIEFSFPREDIGLTIACTFMIGLPILSLLYELKGHFKNGHLLILLTMICSTATLLLFKFDTGPTSPILLLLSDCIIFPTAYAANGIAEGVAALHAVPGTWFSQESLAVFRTVTVGGVGRFLAPPFARAILAVGGRNSYAAAQALIALISVMSAWKMHGHEQALNVEKATSGNTEEQAVQAVQDTPRLKDKAQAISSEEGNKAISVEGVKELEQALRKELEDARMHLSQAKSRFDEAELLKSNSNKEQVLRSQLEDARQQRDKAASQLQAAHLRGFQTGRAESPFSTAEWSNDD